MINIKRWQLFPLKKFLPLRNVDYYIFLPGRVRRGLSCTLPLLTLLWNSTDIILLIIINIMIIIYFVIKYNNMFNNKYFGIFNKNMAKNYTIISNEYFYSQCFISIKICLHNPGLWFMLFVLLLFLIFFN